MTAQRYQITQPILGLRPYVLVEYDGDGEVSLDAGGIDVTDPADLTALAAITAQSARKLRSLAKEARKTAKAAAKEAAK